MLYRNLGKSGIKVSAMSYGHMILAQEKGKTDIYNEKAQELFNQVIKTCLDSGINYFDTAEAYGSGESERTLGIALKASKVPRESIVVSTKIFFNEVPLNLNKYNTYGLSRKHIIEGLRKSLKTMQLDYVDVVFAHRYDPDVPLEEVCRAFDWVINQGLAFYWGTSEWTAEEIRNAHQICDKFNLVKPIVEQPLYNLLARQKFEVEFGSLFDEYGMGSTVYSPLMGGILTGKYNDGVPPNSRLYNDDNKLWYWDIFLKPEIQQKRCAQLKEIEAIAKNELGCTLSQFAIAWCLKNKDVSTALFGASTPQQVKENVAAVQFVDKITNELDQRIEKILDNKPKAYQNWKHFGSDLFMQNRR